MIVGTAVPTIIVLMAYYWKSCIPYQILIESPNLPSCWEKHVIVKDFFKSFGEVTGVYFMDRGQKLVVSFKENKAEEMVGTLIKVPWHNLPLFVREVSSLTLTKI